MDSREVEMHHASTGISDMPCTSYHGTLYHSRDFSQNNDYNKIIIDEIF